MVKLVFEKLMEKSFLTSVSLEA